MSGLAGKPAGNLLGRPALGEAREDTLAQAGVTIQARPRPTTGPGLLMGIRGQVVTGARLISLQLSSNGRWRAIQICSDLPERGSGGT